MPLNLEGPERVLAAAMLHPDKTPLQLDTGWATLDEAVDTEGGLPIPVQERRHDIRTAYLAMLKDDLSAEAKITTLFKANPTFCQGICRIMLTRLQKEPSIPKREKPRILREFFESYLTLLVKLDHEMYPARDTHKGMPAYIPDMFTHMGPDQRNVGRTWEKLCFRKEEIFSEYEELMYDILTGNIGKIETIRRCAEAITSQRTFADPATILATKDEGLFEEDMYGIFGITQNASFASRKLRIGVCRHDAFRFQILMQALGIECRTLPCTMDDGSQYGNHMANLVRVEGQWYLVDITNPSNDKLFMRAVSENFNPEELKMQAYRWRFGANGGTRTYLTHNDVYNQIKEPTHEFRNHDFATDTLKGMRVVAIERTGKDTQGREQANLEI